MVNKDIKLTFTNSAYRFIQHITDNAVKDRLVSYY